MCLLVASKFLYQGAAQNKTNRNLSNALAIMTCTDNCITPEETFKHMENCHCLREVLNIVGDKWSLLVIAILNTGTKRFNEIQRIISMKKNVGGISQRMLSRTLRDLQRSGMAMRRIEPTVPPSTYYSLTPLGKAILVPISTLADWAQKNYPSIRQSQKQFDKNRC